MEGVYEFLYNYSKTKINFTKQGIQSRTGINFSFLATFLR